MRMALRFIFPLLLVLGGIAWGAAPLVGTLMERWFRADVEMRSKLVFHSIQESVTALAAAKADRKIDALFKRITQDERLLALGLCSPDGHLSRHSAAWPKALVCPTDTAAVQSFAVEHLDDGPVLVASFALAIDDADLGRLVILHDLRFIERRSDRAEIYLAAFLTFLGLGAAAVTVIVARITLRGWIRAVRKGLSARDDGRDDAALAPEIAPLVREMRKILRDLDMPHGLTDAIRVEWSPDSLRSVLRSELPGAEVLVVSNREPYIHNLEDGKVTLQRPASGLVTALEPIMRACWRHLDRPWQRFRRPQHGGR